MLEEIFDQERIDYLARRIASISTRTPIRLDELGSLALEVLVMRNNLENFLEEKRSKKQKEAAKKALKQLRELEKGIIHLYFLSAFQRQRFHHDPLLEYMMNLASKYEIESE